MLSSVFILLMALMTPSNEPTHGPHRLEVQELADVLALSQVVINKCSETVVNGTLFEEIRQNLHYERSFDSVLLIIEARAAAAAFEREIARAPSPAAWCNSNYDLYGPAGKAMPGLFARIKYQQRQD